MSLISSFTAHCRQLFPTGDRLLLAVSGGIDSVVLCELCHRAGFGFDIAHANFHLRGEESNEDEKFVRELGARYNVVVHVREFDTKAYAAAKGVSTQVAARDLRYDWFATLLAQGPVWLLTAHHADDNIETVLMNFFRGTGISGLRGILPKHGRIVRPLLPFSKDTLLSFAREQQLVWREDSSNASDKYSRNYFRNKIIPLAKNIFPEAEANLLKNIPRLRDTELLYRQSIEQHKKNLTDIKGNEIHIPVLKLKKAEPLHTILYEIIKPYGFSAHQLSDVVHLLDAEHGKYVQSPTHRVIRNRNWLIIAANDSNEAQHILVEKTESIVPFTGGQLHITPLMTVGGIPLQPTEAVLDSRQVKFPLILRRWKQGDYFYPLGMRKKKKISRFLIDLKLSKTEKEKVWVLESGKRICWVVGLRIDDRFRILPSTHHALRFQVLR